MNLLKMNPLPFQLKGIEFIQNCDGISYLGDVPGLGKSFQSIAYAHLNNLKTLVVCPAYLKFNWVSEINKFTDSSVSIISNSTTDTHSDFFVVNYDILCYPQIQSIINSLKFDLIICDESQYIMNPKSKRTKSLFQVASNIQRKICLSGTPIKSKPEEFFTQLNLLHPEIRDFNTLCIFKIKYCNFKKTTLNNTDDETPEGTLLELFSKISPFYLRRTKSQVLPELPPKIYNPIPIPLPTDYDNNVSFRNCPNPLPLITSIKTSLSLLKLPYIIEHTNNLLQSDEKVIIFSQYTNTIEQLHNYYKGISVIHNGSISPIQKQNNIYQFQNNPNVKILIGNISTAIGYNATVSPNVIYVDLPWTPADIIQSSDRSHRIGQTKNVNVFFFYYMNTLEEQIYHLLYQKQKIFELVVDGKSNLNQDEVFDIQQQIIRKYR